MTDNYYHILGLENFASQQEVKKAYRQLAKKYHPDRNPDKPHFKEKFQRVAKAYQVLADADKKAAYDQILKEQQDRSSTTAQPAYAPRRRHYTSEKTTYSPTTLMYGRIFIIGFILVVILVPLWLFYYTSIKDYEKGVTEYAQGDTYEALELFNRAIVLFGGKSVEAGIKGAEISLYDLNSRKQAQYFLNRGLKYAKKQKDLARLYFLKAKTYQAQKKYQEALKSLQKANSLNYSPDSIQLMSGLLFAFNLHRYEEASDNFDYLIRQEVHPETAWFGKAWCLQNLGFNSKAIAGYSEVIKRNKKHAAAYYYRGINEILLHDSLAACKDFKKASLIGHDKASESFKYHCSNSNAGK